MKNTEKLPYQLPYEELIKISKIIATEMIKEQEFILLTGTYRVEYHVKEKIFIIEERQFDRVELEAEESQTDLGNLKP